MPTLPIWKGLLLNSPDAVLALSAGALLLLVILFLLVIYPERCATSIGRAYRIVHDIRSLTDAAEQYRVTVGRPPVTLRELVPTTVVRLSADRWGNEYIYILEGSDGFSESSHGSDAVKGGTGARRDLRADTDLSKIPGDIRTLSFGRND